MLSFNSIPVFVGSVGPVPLLRWYGPEAMKMASLVDGQTRHDYVIFSTVALQLVRCSTYFRQGTGNKSTYGFTIKPPKQ
jgi:hypothetical protein